MRHQTARSDYGTLLWKEYQWGVDYRLYDIIDHAYKDRDTSFEYDDRGYLVRAIYDRKEEQFRTPDKLGNLYETKDKKDRKYKNSQLQQDRTYYYHYDVEGNLIFKEHIKDVGYRPIFSGGELRDLGINPKSTGKGILYTWNANGSLRSVTDLEGTTYRFRYDAFGRRLEKRRMSSTFRFVWDGNMLLHETFKKDNSKNTELTTWVFEGFVPTAKLVNGKAYSIISDHLGTPILAVDSDGMEVWNRQLDIYGRVRKEYKHSSLGDEVFPFVPFLYQGQYYDFETNLAYNRFRYYSPETGAYISQDPIGLAGGNPTLYGYVENPNIKIDGFGLAIWDDMGMDFKPWFDQASAADIENNIKDVTSKRGLRFKGGKHELFPVSQAVIAKQIGFKADELEKMAISTNKIFFENVIDTDGNIVSGKHHSSSASWHFHNQLIEKLKKIDLNSPDAKLQAKKIIAEHHRKYMRKICNK